MRRMLLAALCAVLMNLSPLFGQGMTLTGSGYASPTPIRVSPGQITTLFASGLNTVLSQPVNANVVPLPTKLAGISVTLDQSTPLPLLPIQQVSVCRIVGPALPPPSS